jgi:AmmeMemoRadiSam system protein A
VSGADESRGRALLRLARSAIETALSGASHPDRSPEAPLDPELERWGASFVTLHRRGELRGCIGALRPRRPLAEDVAANARASAFEDPRFPPVEAAELASLTIEVSVLSPLEPLAVADEQELLSVVQPGRDGLVVEAGPLRATFLPQVWESLPEPAEFVRRLKMKAGLGPDARPPGMRWWRFTVESYEEGDDEQRGE